MHCTSRSVCQLVIVYCIATRVKLTGFVIYARPHHSAHLRCRGSERGRCRLPNVRVPVVQLPHPASSRFCSPRRGRAPWAQIGNDYSHTAFSSQSLGPRDLTVGAIFKATDIKPGAFSFPTSPVVGLIPGANGADSIVVFGGDGNSSTNDIHYVHAVRPGNTVSAAQRQHLRTSHNKPCGTHRRRHGALAP